MSRCIPDKAAAAGFGLVIVVLVGGIAVLGARQLTLEGAFTPSPASPRMEANC